MRVHKNHGRLQKHILLYKETWKASEILSYSCCAWGFVPLTQTQFLMLPSKLGQPQREPKPPALEWTKIPLYWATFLLKAAESTTQKGQAQRSGRKTSTGTKPANKIISAEFCTSIAQKLNDVSQVSLQNCAYINNLFDCCKSLLIKCFLGRKTAWLSKIKAIWVKSANRDLMRENTNSPLKLMSRKLKIP